MLSEMQKRPYYMNDAVRLAVRKIKDNIILDNDDKLYLAYTNEQGHVVHLSISPKFKNVLDLIENKLNDVRAKERELTRKAKKA